MDLLAGQSPERIALSRQVEVDQVVNATDRYRKKMRDFYKTLPEIDIRKVPC